MASRSSRWVRPAGLLQGGGKRCCMLARSASPDRSNSGDAHQWKGLSAMARWTATCCHLKVGGGLGHGSRKRYFSRTPNTSPSWS